MSDPRVQAVIDEAEARASELLEDHDDSDVVRLLAMEVVDLRLRLAEAREERDGARAERVEHWGRIHSLAGERSLTDREAISAVEKRVRDMEVAQERVKQEGLYFPWENYPAHVRAALVAGRRVRRVGWGMSHWLRLVGGKIVDSQGVPYFSFVASDEDPGEWEVLPDGAQRRLVDAGAMG
jgi:hypothetical protein